MTNEERNTALYQKMFAEQEKFRDWLKGQSPEEILNHAYEYTIREDILMSLEYHDLSDAQADALMKSPCPLADVFQDFEKRETDHMETIWDCLESRADMLLEEHRRTLRETPVYPFPASYAQEHGELEQYRASNRANAACKEAIEAAIREHYDGNSLDSQAAAQVVEAFGLDRTLYGRNRRCRSPLAGTRSASRNTAPAPDDSNPFPPGSPAPAPRWARRR